MTASLQRSNVGHFDFRWRIAAKDCTTSRLPYSQLGKVRRIVVHLKVRMSVVVSDVDPEQLNNTRNVVCGGLTLAAEKTDNLMTSDQSPMAAVRWHYI